MPKKRFCAYFEGRVQGVGFRFTAERIANSLNISGWVKNLADGKVEVVAEAEQKNLENFLEQLKSYFKTYIRDVEISWQEPEGLDSFVIKF
ncbi:MAG: acylphosphatase [Candidatus Omnitrophota bacterium]